MRPEGEVTTQIFREEMDRVRCLEGVKVREGWRRTRGGPCGWGAVGGPARYTGLQGRNSCVCARILSVDGSCGLETSEREGTD